MKQILALFLFLPILAFAASCTSPTTVSVAITSTEIIAKDRNYSTALIQNTDATHTVYIAVGRAAAATDIALAPNASITFNPLVPSQAINGLSSATTSNVAVIGCVQ